MQGKVEISGVNTARLQVLSNKETLELLRRSKAGDRAAREKLISGNLRLVLSGDPEIFRPGRKPGRPLSSGLRGTHQGHRRLRPLPTGAVFHLRRAHDCRGDPPLSPGQQRHPREPFGAGYGLPGAPVQGADAAGAGARPKPGGGRPAPGASARRRGQRHGRHHRAGVPL